jgi:hypothetical protein
VQVVQQVRGLQTASDAEARHAALVRFQQGRSEPVVIGNDADFVQLAYAKGDQLANTYFLFDAFPENRTNVDRSVPGLRQVMRLPAMTYDEMLARHRQFIVVDNAVSTAVQRALSDAATVTVHDDAATGVRYWRIQYAAPDAPDGHDSPGR